MAAGGKALAKSIIDDLAARGLEPTVKEHELIAVAQGLADQLVGLRKSLAARGYSCVLNSGRVVVNPAIAAINTTSLALAKVLDQISMTEMPAKNAKKQHAAQVRWAAHNQAKTRWAGVGGQ